MKHPIPVTTIAILIAIGATCPTSAATTAYIANSGGDDVLKVIASSDAVTTTPVSDTPYGITVTPDGELVLVTQNEGDSLAFIDASNFSETPFALAVGNFPRGVAVDPTGKYAYVANFDDDTVSQINISGRSTVDTIDVGDGPVGVAAHYDEQKDTPVVYVACYRDDTVVIIDEENQTSVIRVDDGPTGLAVTPDGGHVYVANTNDDTVSVIDTKTGTVVDTVGVGRAPWGVAVGAKGKYVYVTNSTDDTVTVVDTTDNSIVRTLRVGDTPRGVAAPINGTFAYVVNQGDGSISKIDMDDETVTEFAVGMVEGAYSIGAFIGDRPPTPPSALEAKTRDENSIELSWTDESDTELGFKIERSQENEDNYTQIATVAENSTSYEDFDLSSDTVYFYRIRAYSEAADSKYGSSASATTDPYTGSIWCFIGTLTP